MEETEKVLRTAANGMEVWVPVDKLEAWEKAQADNSPEAEQRREARVQAMLKMLNALSSHRKEESDTP